MFVPLVLFCETATNNYTEKSAHLKNQVYFHMTELINNLKIKYQLKSGL